MFNQFFRLSSASVIAIMLTATWAKAEFTATEGDSLAGNYLAGRSADTDKASDLASEYLSRALIKDPHNQVITEKLLQLEVAAGDIPAAEELAIKVLASNSQHRLARIVLGLRDFRNQHFAKARKNFDEAAYTPVGELTSKLLVAWSYAGENNLTEGLKILDQLGDNEAFNNFRLFHAALMSDLLKNPVRAESTYKKIYQQSGGSLRVVQAYGNFLERHNQRDEAIRIYETYLKDGSDNVLIVAALKNAKAGAVPAPFITSASAGASEALFSLASAMTDEQTADIALLYTQLALTLNGDRPVVTTLLGDIYVDLQQYENAIKAYSQIPDASPLKVNAETEIAVNYARLEKNKEAQAKLEQVLVRDPTNADAMVTLGNIYRNADEFQKAADVYSKAIALFPQPGKDQWQLFYNRGVAYERLKMWDKAEPDFRKALALSPDEPSALNYLGYSMIDRKVNLDEALSMVKKAVAAKPNDGYIIDSLGWAYYQLGDYDQALEQLERAVDLNPADPTIGEHLGDVYWRLGRKLEAKFQWQHAKDNKPAPEDLKKLEDKLLNGLPDVPAVTPAQNQPVPNPTVPSPPFLNKG